MNKELTIKPTNNLVVHTKSALMGVASSLSTSDIQMPSLILMQANSTFVDENDDINAGDFIHSISHESWGKKNSDPVDLVFFDMFKTIVQSNVSAAMNTWIGTQSWLPEHDLIPYEEERIVEGQTMMVRTELCFNYMCFRTLEVREMAHPVTGEVQFVASPIVVKFKGASKKVGKRLNSTFSDYASVGAPSWATSFIISAKQEEKDGSKYWVWDFKRGEQTLPEVQLAAEKLCKEMDLVKDTMVVVDTDETPADIDITPAAEKKKAVKNYADNLGDIV